jgi:hypothetical protein
LKGRTAARPNSRAPPSTYPRVRTLGYLLTNGAYQSFQAFKLNGGAAIGVQ